MLRLLHLHEHPSILNFEKTLTENLRSCIWTRILSDQKLMSACISVPVLCICVWYAEEHIRCSVVDAASYAMLTQILTFQILYIVTYIPLKDLYSRNCCVTYFIQFYVWAHAYSITSSFLLCCFILQQTYLKRAKVSHLVFKDT